MSRFTNEEQALTIVQDILVENMIHQGRTDDPMVLEVGSVQDKTVPIVFQAEDGSQHVAFVQVRYGQPL